MLSQFSVIRHISVYRLTRPVTGLLVLQVQLNKEIDSRISAESVSASAKESVKELERALQKLSENSEREKKALKKELSYMQDDSKLSFSKLNAEVCIVRLL
jgi:mitotic spindle assembly checkpoint protein MAD1